MRFYDKNRLFSHCQVVPAGLGIFYCVRVQNKEQRWSGDLSSSILINLWYYGLMAVVPSEVPATEVAAMKELVEVLAKALVDYPDQLELTEIAGGETLMIELKAAKEDLGKIIGKKGRNVQAMRTILNGASRKLGKHVVLEIIDQ